MQTIQKTDVNLTAFKTEHTITHRNQQRIGSEDRVLPKLKLYGRGRLYKIRHTSHSCCFDSEGQANNKRPLVENQ